MHCIDDIMTSERVETIHVAYKVWRKFVDLCGWDVPDEKSPPPADLFRVLGAMIDLTKTPLSPVIRLAEDRYEKLLRSAWAVLDAQSLGAGLAGQLFGQFGFSCSQFFGGWGRASY